MAVAQDQKTGPFQSAKVGDGRNPEPAPSLLSPLRIRKWEKIAGHTVSITLTRQAIHHPDDVALHAAIRAFSRALDNPRPAIPDVTHGEPIRYRGYRIYRNDFTAHPDWRDVAWVYVHEDYDGPEDNRCGHGPSVEACITEIQESEEG